MMTKESDQQTLKEKVVSAICAILAILCIALFTIAMTAEGSTGSENSPIPETIEEAISDQDPGIQEEIPVEVEVEQKDPELAQGYVRVAEVFAELFQYNDGLPWAREAIRLDPDLPEAHFIHGYLHFKLVHSADAIESFEECIELDPSYFEAYLNLGIIYRAKGELSLGLEYFNQAIRVARNVEELSKAYAERGLMYGVMDRFEESFADFDRALVINPDNGWVLFYRESVIQKLANRENSGSGQTGNLEPGAGVGFGF